MILWEDQQTIDFGCDFSNSINLGLMDDLVSLCPFQQYFSYILMMGL